MLKMSGKDLFFFVAIDRGDTNDWTYCFVKKISISIYFVFEFVISAKCNILIEQNVKIVV